MTVYGGSSRVAALTKQVKDRDMLKIGNIEVACVLPQHAIRRLPARDYLLTNSQYHLVLAVAWRHHATPKIQSALIQQIPRQDKGVFLLGMRTER